MLFGLPACQTHEPPGLTSLHVTFRHGCEGRGSASVARGCEKWACGRYRSGAGGRSRIRRNFSGDTLCSQSSGEWLSETGVNAVVSAAV